MCYPSLEQVKSRMNEGNLIPVYREIIADLETPVSAFMKINKDGNSFLLESVEGGQRLARYSFIGTDPYKIISSEVNDDQNPLEAIRNEFKKYKYVNVEGMPRFVGGAVGFLSYETVRHFENLPSPKNSYHDLPESIFLLTDTFLIFDHVTHSIKAVSMVRMNGDIDSNYRAAADKIDILITRLKAPLPSSGYSVNISNQPYTSNFTKESFCTAVNKIKQHIVAGDAIQVVLSQRFMRATGLPPFEIYRSLRSINPSPYMFYFDFNDFQIIGASPEILVRVEEGQVMTRPLAGTRPRGKTPEEDKQLEEELQKDEKERAEHIMLVDLGRNDIGRVSEPGTVKVSELMEIERYSHVMHMVTHVQGSLQKGLNSFDALQACFPAGTVSGAPKIKAMEIIAGYEPDKRGPYAGSCGYFSFSGSMDMAISIRTIVMKSGTASIQSGCGIVYDSIPEKEYNETLNKAKALMKAVDEAENTVLRMEE
jgi:anthranilate synthase component I